MKITLRELFLLVPVASFGSSASSLGLEHIQKQVEPEDAPEP